MDTGVAPQRARTPSSSTTRKSELEADNLECWKGEAWLEFPYLPPPREDAFDRIAEAMTDLLRKELGA